MINWDVVSYVKTDEELELERKADLARNYLKDTDWYVIRKFELDTPIPYEIVSLRAKARLDIDAV